MLADSPPSSKQSLTPKTTVLPGDHEKSEQCYIMTVNIWKSYMCFAVEETNRSDLRSYEHNKTIS